MIKRYGAAAAGLLLIGSACSDLLTETPEDFLAPENFYQTAADAEAAIAAVYEPLPARDGLGYRGWHAISAMSDDERIGDQVPGFTYLGAFQITPSDNVVAWMWSTAYLAVSRANLAIAYIPEMDLDPVRRQALVGEARFLRALSYFYLTRLYGDVPMITEPEQASDAIARAPREEVFAQIIADAQAAVASLPETRDAPNAGRATRGSALALLTDVYLWQRDWQSAVGTARQIIDSGRYALFESYLHAFLPEYENGSEHVFTLQANGPVSRGGTAFVNMYYPREIGRGRGGGNGLFQPTQWHYDSYVDGDYRKDVTYQTHWVNLDGESFDLYPHVFKYRPSQVTDINNGDIDTPVYRYSDVLLMYAEAVNELGQGSEAIEYVNMVRARARHADGSDRLEPRDYVGPTDTDAVREVVFQERRWELAHEAKRWFDLTRRGPEYLVSQLQAHDPEGSTVQPHHLLFPVPQSEIDLNAELTQNPGY
jgi:starch-binding outer membrane protein, SusD/RagB family